MKLGEMKEEEGERDQARREGDGERELRRGERERRKEERERKECVGLPTAHTDNLCGTNSLSLSRTSKAN